MSIFENLIEELKKDQLIEEGVFENAKKMPIDKTEETLPPTVETAFSEKNAEDINSPESHQVADFELVTNTSADISPASENEFFRRRAMEEVSSLQMVEHILSGVEREQLKVMPKTYDSIPVSQALHEFLQISKGVSSSENATAEFKLMQETESWHSALARRDKNILSAQLRRYCETVKPVLSAQALAALARFYRNSPYSEQVRSKFDMVVTRLFSHEESNEREMAFSRDEIIQHLSELYADWASVSLYATDDDSEIIETVGKLEKFIDEAESATAFESLVKSDFFNRLREFKEKAGENCFAPTVAAAIITCNISVGNVFVRLLKKASRQTNPESLENKYSYLLDQSASEAASKTLKLTALLGEKIASPPPEEKIEELELENFTIEPKTENTYAPRDGQKQTFFGRLMRVNKILLGATLFVIVFNVGLLFWTNTTEPEINREGVGNFQSEGYYFKDYLRSSKLVNDNLICIVKQNWDSLGDEKKKEVLKNMLEVGREKGFSNVWLQNGDGKTVAYVSQENISNVNSKPKQ